MSALFPYKTKIRLETMKDIYEFVNIVNTIDSPVYLEDGSDFRVNAKSIIGAVASLEWSSLYCISAEDIYSKVSKFAI